MLAGSEDYGDVTVRAAMAVAGGWQRNFGVLFRMSDWTAGAAGPESGYACNLYTVDANSATMGLKKFDSGTTLLAETDDFAFSVDAFFVRSIRASSLATKSRREQRIGASPS